MYFQLDFNCLHTPGVFWNMVFMSEKRQLNHTGFFFFACTWKKNARPKLSKNMNMPNSPKKAAYFKKLKY